MYGHLAKTQQDNSMPLVAVGAAVLIMASETLETLVLFLNKMKIELVSYCHEVMS